MKVNLSHPVSCAALSLAFATSAWADTTNLSSVADACMFEHDPNNSLGGSTYVIAGTLNQNFKSRALFKFDVAGALPSGAIISAATLTLTVPVARAVGKDFSLHRILQDWGEGEGAGSGGGQGSPAATGDVTWNARFHPATLWNAPGGTPGTDYATPASATNTMGDSTLIFTSANMATDAQAWLVNPGTNFGWLVIIANETPVQTANHIATREHSEPANAPTLTLEYTLPAPPTPPNLYALARVGNQIRFSFDGEAGRTYTVQFRDSLTTGDWNPLTNIPALSGNTTLHITNAIGPDPRYYRTHTP